MSSIHTTGLQEAPRAIIWGSTFKIVEAPMRYFNNLQNTYGNQSHVFSGGCLTEFFRTSPTNFTTHTIDVLAGLIFADFQEIKRGVIGWKFDITDSFVHTYKKRHLVAISLGTTVVFPLTPLFTPASIIADIFAGIIQSGLRGCQGASRAEIRSILHKKIIASPVQQATYASISAAALPAISISALIFLSQRLNFDIPPKWYRKLFPVTMVFFSAFMGNSLYCASQEVVSRLPKFFKPEGYNVFIDNGATNFLGHKPEFDPEKGYQEWREKWGESRNSNQSRGGRAAASDWEKEKEKTRNELGTIPMRHPEKFKELTTWLDSSEPPHVLFGFKNESEVTKTKLQNRYKLLALKYHPDKCPENLAEATAWMKLINEIRNCLERTAPN